MADVKTGQIGATIEQEPNRLKEFFTDPKNLATLLVLGAAIGSPKRRGTSNLGHALRGGVGALAFRGGLDQQITQQQMKEEEAESVQDRRAAQSQAEQGQIAATNRRTGVLDDYYTGLLENQRLDRAQELLLLERQQKGVDFSSFYNEALKGYYSAMEVWTNNGGPASGLPQPDFKQHLLQAAMAAQLSSGGSLGFVPTETTVPPPGEAPPPAAEVPEVREKKMSRNTRTKLIAVSRRTGAGMESADDATLERYRNQINSDVEASIPNMTNEEALETWKTFGRVLDPSIVTKLKIRIRETSEGAGQRLGQDLVMTFGLRGLVGEDEETTEVETPPPVINRGTAQ